MVPPAPSVVTDVAYRGGTTGGGAVVAMTGSRGREGERKEHVSAEHGAGGESPPRVYAFFFRFLSFAFFFLRFCCEMSKGEP